MDGSDLFLPPGFRFHPTDEELVTYYLCRKCAGQPISAPIIAEIDLYKYDPWDLPGMARYGEKEWYFFSPRDRKYPNGCRPNRAAGTGYWKATGADKPIGYPKPAAIKKSLVFYAGKPPKGIKTNWIMHEYRLADVDRSARKKSSGSLRLDEWVLCRIYNKKGVVERDPTVESNKSVGLKRPSLSSGPRPSPALVEPKMEEEISHVTSHVPAVLDLMNLELDRPEWDSSGSEHVLSPEFTCERGEVIESQPTGWEDWDPTLGFGFNNEPATAAFPPSQPLSPAFFAFPDALSYLQKPF